jgi:cell division protein FtsB
MHGQPSIEQRQQVITRLKNENAKLRAQIAALEKENALLKLAQPSLCKILEGYFLST